MIETIAQCNDSSDLQVRFLQRNTAKEIYSCNDMTYVNKTLRYELKIIKEVLSHPLQYNLNTTIAHLVIRDPDFVTYGDVCSETAEDFSEDLKFWWHTEFPPSIKYKTLKNLTVTRRCPMSQELVSINLLELLTEIFNFVAI